MLNSFQQFLCTRCWSKLAMWKINLPVLCSPHDMCRFCRPANMTHHGMPWTLEATLPLTDRTAICINQSQIALLTHDCYLVQIFYLRNCEHNKQRAPNSQLSLQFDLKTVVYDWHIFGTSSVTKTLHEALWNAHSTLGHWLACSPSDLHVNKTCPQAALRRWCDHAGQLHVQHSTHHLFYGEHSTLCE